MSSLPLDLEACCEDTPSGVSLAVRAQPRASRNALVGVVEDVVGGRSVAALKIAIAAPPVEGAANEAIERFLAELLEVPRRAVSIASGERGRGKRVTVAGLGRREVIARLRLHIDSR